MAMANRAGSLDVKLIDFGLAKGAGSETLDAARITRTQDFVGSPAFASPEQCETKKLDTRSDIYSLGVTLWYLLSGKRPFSGSVGEVMIAQVIKPPPFDQLAHLPAPVLELLRRMLAKSPDDRYQTPQELQDAVEGIAAGLAAEFGTVPERIVAKPEPEKKESRGSGPLQVEPPATAEPLLLTTLASPLFDSYLGVEVGAMVGGRYRLVREEREGNGGRLFLAQDEKASSRQSAIPGARMDTWFFAVRSLALAAFLERGRIGNFFWDHWLPRSILLPSVASDWSMPACAKSSWPALKRPPAKISRTWRGGRGRTGVDAL